MRYYEQIQGFSLVELLVVLSIISTLVGLVTPRVRNFKIKAGRVEAFTSLNVLNALYQSYLEENDMISSSIMPHYGYGQSRGTSWNNWYPSCSGSTNLLGFKTTSDCERTRYSYHISTGNYFVPFSSDTTTFGGVTPNIAKVYATSSDWQYGGSGGGRLTSAAYCEVETIGGSKYDGYFEFIFFEFDGKKMWIPDNANAENQCN